MLSVGISDIQKNISLLSNPPEVIAVFDKRKNKQVATIYPVNKKSVVAELAGKYDIDLEGKDLNQIKEEAMTIAMQEKYGPFN
jgi:hypothetical protein